MKTLNNQEIDKLLLKCIEGNATSDEYSIAWKWIQQSKENRNYYEKLRDINLSVSIFQAGEAEKANNAWVQFSRKNLPDQTENSESEKGKLLIIISHFAKIAAIFILAFFLGGITFPKLVNRTESNVRKSHTYLIEAPRGAKSFVTMPDGTKIWLNAGSFITYSNAYNIGNRDINLEGEAYFVVAKNQELPFYVRSAGVVIRAVGTSFNVKAYPEEDIVETTLVEGKIIIESVSESGKTEKLELEPNQKASFYKSFNNSAPATEKTPTAPILAKKESKIKKIEVAGKIDTENYTSWKDKRWVFREQRMDDFAVMLERIYDVKISFRDEDLKNYSLSGSFDEVSLEQVLDAIRLTVPLDYSVEHDHVIFSLNSKLKSKYDNLLKSYRNN